MNNETFSTASEIKAIFDRIAPVYDQLNNWLSLGQHKIWKQMAVKWCEAKKGDRALDLCCGSGDLSFRLAKTVGKTGKVVGVDFSPQQLAIARQRATQYYPFFPIDWQEGDALALPLGDNTFDCGTMGYGLRNVTDIPRCLEEIKRVLKPGAKFAILDFHRPSNTLMQTFQDWYLQAFVVPTAQHFGLKEEYAYISPSLERFPGRKQQIALALEAGFSNAIHYPIAGGMMGILVLTKA